MKHVNKYFEAEKIMETIRLNKIEQKQIEKKLKEINKVRVMNELDALTRSDIVHICLATSLRNLRHDKQGEVILDLP